MAQVLAAAQRPARVLALSIPVSGRGQATDREAANTPDRLAAEPVEQRHQATPRAAGTMRGLVAVPAQEQVVRRFIPAAWVSAVPARKGKAQVDGAGLALAELVPGLFPCPARRAAAVVALARAVPASAVQARALAEVMLAAVADSVLLQAPAWAALVVALGSAVPAPAALAPVLAQPLEVAPVRLVSAQVRLALAVPVRVLV